MIAATIVSCVAGKLDHRAPARELYSSSWFRKARAYAEQRRRPWWILSAKHHLVHPDAVLEPYEFELSQLKKPQRISWARTCAMQLLAHVGRNSCVELLAGQVYRKHLRGELERKGVEVVVPMQGMQIGEQLAWLTQQVRP